ncbi:MAG: hypothetical protein Kow0092_24280 [Deferrisomatales bacterium]
MLTAEYHQGTDAFRRHFFESLCARLPCPCALVFDDLQEVPPSAPVHRALVRRCRLVPAEAPVHVEGWPWPLRIYTLGRFEIVQDEEPLRFTGKVQHKPLALLRALLAFGGRKVDEWRLSGALWPDADGDLAHQSFATTLLRLRRLLGVREALDLHDSKLTLDARYARVDAWAFERLLTAAERARKRGRPEEARRRTEEALGLYRGRFLPQATGEPWTRERRERLRSRYLRAVETLCGGLEARRHPGEPR